MILSIRSQYTDSYTSIQHIYYTLKLELYDR